MKKKQTSWNVGVDADHHAVSGVVEKCREEVHCEGGICRNNHSLEVIFEVSDFSKKALHFARLPNSTRQRVQRRCRRKSFGKTRGKSTQNGVQSQKSLLKKLRN